MLIRPIALAAIRRGDDLLVFEAHDPVKRETFYRPLGGGIEFGERAADALRREIREEIGVELDGVVLLGVLENIFIFSGRPGHEIAFIFTADITDTALYQRDTIGEILDNDNGETVTWQPLRRFAAGGAPLSPDGLFELLTAPSRRSWTCGCGNPGQDVPNEAPQMQDRRGTG
jgi:ADP-ribose pyrophosphatase YjhB (NUDIX family)